MPNSVAPLPSFRGATAVRRVDEPVTGDTAARDTAAGDTATYRAEVQPGWDIYDNANGGYLLALVARAMQDWTGRPPLTTTTHFLAPGRAGPARIELSAVRIGGRLATIRGQLWQGDQQVIEVLASVGNAGPHAFTHSTLAPPELLAFDDPLMIPSEAEVAVSPAIFSAVDVRLTPAASGFRRGEPSGVSESVGWFAFRDPSDEIDEVALLLAADVFPPPVFNLDGPVGWVPTVELTVHVRARPAAGPLRCRFVSGYIADGLIGEDGELWDSTDRLVCQSRQLALVPRG